MKKNYLACCFLLATSGITLVNAQSKKVGDSIKQKNIDEVVITAYGIKKEKKSLGYVYQDIKGTSLVDARENNVTNALVGKVSGLQVVKSSVGPAASSKIILRGFNSLTGDNQPLIIVDGVPMENFSGASNNDYWNPTPDMGNGLSDINPDDIENVTVLKGGAASALYGSRAGNGVIVITTKSGRASKGVGITYSNTTQFQELFVYPKVQTIFSQGNNGTYISDPSKPETGSSWGEKNDGKYPIFDNIRNFFNTGYGVTHALTFQQKYGKSTNFYTSASYMDDEGAVPNATYKRLNLTNRLTSEFGANNNWSMDIKVQYINAEANNRPISGANAGNYYGTVLTMPTTLDITQYKEGMNVLGAKQKWFYDTGNNPYWVVYNRLNSDVRNRFLLNGKLKYKFNSWLDTDVRVGSDMYYTKRDSKIYTGGPLQNFYSIGMDKFIENNYIVSLNAHKDNIIGKWGASLSLFGQIMTQNSNSNGISATLSEPNLFSVNNAVDGRPGVSESIYRKQINSAFATLDINYDGFWFFNATGRNDWSSTMSKANRSYFYPSVSSSLVVTDMFKKLSGSNPFGNVISFLKLRASYAATGNSLEPYQLVNLYRMGFGPNGEKVASQASKIKFNPNVVNELLKTKEFGANIRFFNRFDLDVNYYDTHATNQLITIPMNAMSGYEGRMINAGNIQNKGWEIVLNSYILKDQEFKWNMLLNLSKNTNKILALDPEVDRKSLGSYDNLGIWAIVGERYGTILGSRYLRVKEGEHAGRIVVDGNGLPEVDPDRSALLGDQTPRALLGFTNSFSYKGLSLSFQVDGRFGGQFFSGTMNTLKASGLANETVVNGDREEFVVNGVVSDGKGGYVENTKKVTPQVYWQAVSSRGGNLGINEENIYDATNVRLRNIQLSYSFPKSMFEGTVIQNAKASISINNVAMLYSKVKGIDPESVYAVGSNAVGFENMSFPTMRSYVFNLTIGF